MDRKLAAILAADVVGYAALMEADEAGTHERLKAGRQELFEPEISRHRGRVFKVMGDGMLAEFGSVVDAVECAVALQRGLAERNAAMPEGHRIQIRIGINLGEVIVEGEDRYGEGVNIATRLEQLAEPGGIYISGKVAKEVEKRLAFGFEPMGEQKFKNIAEPVSVFRIKLDGTPARRPRPLPSQRAWPWAVALAAVVLVIAGAWFASRPSVPEAVVALDPVVADARPSLVVLPFANLSDDKEQGYLADGITEDLTTELARVPGLFVFSRNAAYTYKGKAVAPAQIAKELGVRYILEGSTRRAGEEMRIHAQLIDTRTGGHLWAERFDGAWVEVFALQDKVVASVAGTLKLKLVPSSAEEAGGTNNAAAYEAYLRGWDLRKRDSIEDFVKAANYFKQALVLDPNFGAADASLAMLYWDANQQRQTALGLSSWEETNAKLLEHLEAAAKHPSTDYYGMLAQLLVRQQKSDEAIEALQKAIALNPSESWIYTDMSQALIFNGRAADGLAFLDSALRVDPGWKPWRYYIQGLAYFSQDRFADAATSLQRIDLQSDDFWAKFYGLQVLLSAYGHLGRDADSAAVEEQLKPLLNEINPGQELSGLFTQNFFAFKNHADFQRLLHGLKKAGVPEVLFGMNPASEDRLTGAEIAAVLYGHELEGRNLDRDENYWQGIAADGTAQIRLGAWSDTGNIRIEGNTYCVYWRIELRYCNMVFRKPKGTLERRNEYLQISSYHRIEFSVVK
jgi:TolB-like protein/class 3 adenylate cyclase/tetratricopeptide (TPR) repeat protein